MSSSFAMVLHSGNVLKVEYENRWKWRPDGTWDMFLVVKLTGLLGHACLDCVGRGLFVVDLLIKIEST